MAHLKVVQKPDLAPKEAVKRRIRRTSKPVALIQCHRCGSREMIETRTGVMLKDGKPTGGTKSLLCAMCWAKGERVLLL